MLNQSIICPSLTVDIYIDGDFNDQLSSSYPILLLNPHQNNTSASISYHVYASKLSQYARDKSAVKYLGPLSSPNLSFDTSSVIVKPSPEGFVPGYCSSLSANMSYGEDFAVAVNCLKQESSNQLLSESILCILNYAKGFLTSTFSQFIWGARWEGQDDSVRPGMLVIDESFRKLLWLSTSPSDFGLKLSEWNLSLRVSRIYTPLDITVKMVLLLSPSENDRSPHRLIGVITTSGQSFAIDMNTPSLHLLLGENIKSVEWMPPCRRDHLKNKLGILAVLTTSRVLILDKNMSILSLYIIASGEIVSSILWIGFALAFMNDAGIVRYILPGKLNHSATFSSRSLLLRKHNIVVNDTGVYDLCSIPKIFGLYSTGNLICCLPDRLIFSVASSSPPSPSSCLFSLSSRPITPLEPLVLGILWARTVETYDVNLLERELTALLHVYLGSKTSHSSEQGATSTTHCSLTLISLLFASGLPEHAAVAAEIDLSAASSTSFVPDGEMPRMRWIPSILKYEIMKSLMCYRKACIELLSAYPEVVEMIVDPSHSTVALPRKNSRAASLCEAASNDYFIMKEMEFALLLADVSGNDHLLAKYLHSLGREEDLILLCNQIQPVNSVLHASVKRLLSEGNASDQNETLSIILNDLGQPNRRATLLKQWSAVDKPYNPIISISEADRRKHEILRGGGIGPPTRLGTLAADCVEDWMGSQNLELINVGGKPMTAASTVATQRDAIDNPTNEAMNEDALPSTWVPDVGRGKEWDLCSGYWRFSDMILPHDEDFVSTCLPNAKANFVDLSKYGAPIELYAVENAQISLEPSISSVDPGEDHEKVKLLYDIIFGAVVSMPGSGLRCAVPRGGPLDVGMYHFDQDRCRFTLEACLYKLERTDSSTELIIASRRLCNKDEGQNGVIWSLIVDTEGSLIFKFGFDSTHSLSSGANSVNMGPTVELDTSVWTHIAMVIDSAETDDEGGKFPEFCRVQLFVNAVMKASKTLFIPSISESDLSKTVLYIFPDAFGWRLTELRLWACARSESDIDNQKDNYLSLASKRKRLQYRIKGGKKLFGPLSNLDIGSESSQVQQNVTKASPRAAVNTATIMSKLAAPGLLKSPVTTGRHSKIPVILNPTQNLISISSRIVGSLSAYGLSASFFTNPLLLANPHAYPGSILGCVDGEIFLLLISSSGMSSVKYKLAAESVILSPNKESRILALLSNKRLSVFNTDTRKKLAEQPISTALVFWKFLDNDTILLVTPSVLYTWQYQSKDESGGPSRPKKLCSRIDSHERERVVDASFIDDWLMLLLVSDDMRRRVSLINCKDGHGSCFDAFSGMLERDVAEADTMLYLLNKNPENPQYYQLKRFSLNQVKTGKITLEKPHWSMRLEGIAEERLTLFEPFKFLKTRVKNRIVLICCSEGRIHFIDSLSSDDVSNYDICDGESVLSIQGSDGEDFITLVLNDSAKIMVVQIQDITFIK